MHLEHHMLAPGYGGYDYLSVDSVSRTLFIAREFGVRSMKLESKAVVGRVMAASDVSAVVPISGEPLMLVTAYGNDQATLFDWTTGRRVAEIPTGTNPDAAIYDNSGGLGRVYIHRQHLSAATRLRKPA